MRACSSSSADWEFVTPVPFVPSSQNIIDELTAFERVSPSHWIESDDEDHAPTDSLLFTCLHSLEGCYLRTRWWRWWRWW